jgi:hypothetical protein
MTPSYVLLTGAKNNAGDFLIRHRARALLEAIRPDRSLIEFNAWEAIDEERLAQINASEALLLTGGPALQPSMADGVYRLDPALDRIRVPIMTFGIGWKSVSGRWQDTRSYPLSAATLRLLERIEATPGSSSVRDYHTLNVLESRGFKSFTMTGCPALYELEHVGRPFTPPDDVAHVTFSLGVGFATSRSLEQQLHDALLRTRDVVAPATQTAAYHHGLDRTYLDSPGANQELWRAHQRLRDWLETQGIAYVDVSGSVEALLDHYAVADLHVGYRVHAHILMSSLSKPSLLVAEDGRGTALSDVLGGVIVTAHDGRPPSLARKALRRLGLPVDRVRAASHLADDLAFHLTHELRQGFPRMAATRSAIDRHYDVMASFLRRLP